MIVVFVGIIWCANSDQKQSVLQSKRLPQRIFKIWSDNAVICRIHFKFALDEGYIFGVIKKKAWRKIRHAFLITR